MIGKWTRLVLSCLVFLAIPGAAAGSHVIIPAEKGPPVSSGVLTRLWREDFPDVWSDALLLDDVLVVAHGSRVEGRDPATGRTLWAFGTPGVAAPSAPKRRLKAAGDLVVGVATHWEPESDSLVVFNGRTGVILWDLATGGRGPDAPVPPYRFLGAGNGRVVLHLPGLRLLRGLDVTDGRRRWESPLPPGCQGRSADADERVVAVLLACGDQARLRVLEPATGRVMWEREVFPLGEPSVTVRGGTVGLAGNHVLTVYDGEGRRLYEGLLDWNCDCALTVSDTALLVLRNDPETAATVADAVDRRTGRVVRLAGGWNTFRNGWVVGERIYATRRLGDLLHGNLLVEVDPESGGQRPVVALPDHLFMVAMNRHILLVEPRITNPEHNRSLAAYRVTPGGTAGPGTALPAGVAPGDWPEACALIPPAALRTEVPGARYTAVPRPAPRELGVRAPAGCDLIPQDTRHPILSVSVLWVAGTEDEAEDVFRTAMANLRVEDDKAVTLRSGVRLYTDRDVDTAIVRVERIVLRVDGTLGRGLVERLARQAARTLRAVR
ncbi:hypothetical protein GCM10010106_05460 [Thermopolyspora flexuosa]|uniref:Putative pyrroloquinoline-quinone binding quinoprotein n=1 Tax=Thermopolyspora flexuosa TaxID=103836 RepID=A0A543IZ38_9ACTN|nr:PQQ-binding-like beta-propeller repeat protein [Thermopolyspora flexuosa]TQM75827.1 putative pyrroloquinoline-quinone binding quinoprotein [Thermopolyspora flexuosa]GGM62338.1 hypothetical protein GCM10010106_05460 [Thermopolyspora flexuosa]